MEQGGNRVAKDDLTVAKINATVKILEWSKDDLEPGIGGTPSQLHIALSEAFRSIYTIVSEAVGPGQGAGSSNGADSEKAEPVESAIT